MKNLHLSLLILISSLLTSVGQHSTQVNFLDLSEPITAQGRVGGISIDKLGFLYVSNFNNSLWRVSPSGEVKLLSDAFYGSSGNAIDQFGNIYQSNFYGNSISKFDRNGTITLYSEEHLDGPVGLIFSMNNDLYVANCRGNYISSISGKTGVTSKVATGAEFACPNGLALDDKNNLYVTNFNNDQIVKIDPDGNQSIFATIPGGDGNAHIAFYNNNFYVTKIKANLVFQVSMQGVVQLLAGNQKNENIGGNALEASLNRPNGITVDQESGELFITTIKGNWLSRQPSEIKLAKVKIATIQNILEWHIENEGIEAAIESFWNYKNAPSNGMENLGPPTGKLAWSYMKKGNPDIALKLFETMAKAYPDRWRPWYYQGEVYRYAGKPKKAKEFYLQALQRDKDNEEVKKKLALIEQ